MTAPHRMASKILRTVHETVADLFEIEAFDKAAVREFDLLCLAAAKGRTPEAIQELRRCDEARPASRTQQRSIAIKA